MNTCATCKSPLDLPGRPWTVNCGGECRACMVMFNDPDEIVALREGLATVLLDLE